MLNSMRHPKARDAKSLYNSEPSKLLSDPIY